MSHLKDYIFHNKKGTVTTTVPFYFPKIKPQASFRV